MNRCILVVLTLVVTLLGAPAKAVSPAPSAPGVLTAKDALAAQLKRDPGGKVVRNKIYYGHRVFVAVDAGTLSLGQCGSGQFCIWSSTTYTGSFIYKTGQDVTRSIQTTVGSFYNNRGHAARLYSNTGASSICYGANDKKASVSASYNAADKVFLSSTTSC